ncbi:50S ribosomal protein L4 [Hippea maritima]|uniref:Large ribosomal subunit protein uL4 n=1 Tax=Hippea maritima (strain ATCC 700847 / DSM 10411 / MH2) TaxID=760142 RepID=F2LXU1_HIPMA|nr:50S ribosomal protein L4 [Hippea maritima]AEA34332.1 ribosomal protein L4/L1e [Hippea maritima DSM 10411]
MKVKVVDKKNQAVGEVEINIQPKEVKNKGVLFNRVVRAMLMNARQGTASTKTRGEVSGGGKKPWRQKGTGRARAGSIRSPLWVGGGVIFGPKPRDYELKMNKKEKRVAFIEALAQRIEEGKLIVIDDLSFEKPKTRDAYEIVKNLNLKKALFVLEKGMENAYLSLRNIKGVEVRNIDTLNTYDVLRFQNIIIPKTVVEKLNGRIANG